MEKRQKDTAETMEQAARRLLAELNARTKNPVAGLRIGHANLYLVCLDGDRMEAPETQGCRVASPGFCRVEPWEETAVGKGKV